MKGLAAVLKMYNTNASHCNLLLLHPAADPAKYIHPDLRLRPLLDMLRVGGKKLFVATNRQSHPFTVPF